MITIKRPKKFIILFTLPLTVLMAIILNISVFKGSYYANMAANQRTGNKTSRGIIADRHMIPFTSDDSTPNDTSYAPHVVGYTDSDGKGISGIEKSFNSFLETNSNIYGTFLKDAEGNDIPNFKSASKRKNLPYVKLTLDYHIQKITENVLDSFEMSGAAVILAVENFDVLAMASRPDFDRSSVNEYVSHGDTELLNRATAPYNAGSIFKIITTAAAMEEGMINEDFSAECTGSMDIDNIIFPCHLRQGHGIVDISTAFAGSCNCAFYGLGIDMGSETICRYSKGFRLGSQLLGGVITESGGNIPEFLSFSQSEAANLSIGQGEIMITPLQGANIACIIASGGVAKSVNIADSILNEDGSIIKNLRKCDEQRILSEETAAKIGEMMLKVTTDGTGKNAACENFSVAGKTGSAETGWETEEGCMVQGWFIGYFPYEAPRYAMAIMTENGRQGNTSCGPIFKEIAARIMEIR